MRRILDRSRVEALCGPTRAYHIVSEILPWVFFLLTAALLAAFWGRIPQQIPLNTDFQGNVTGWGDKGDLLVLCGVYFILNLTLWITGYFPQSWNNGLRLRVTSPGKRQSSVKNYPLTRDLLCDLRISMSLVFSGLLLWTAFGQGRRGLAVVAGVVVCVLVPMARFLIRMALHR